MDHSTPFVPRLSSTVECRACDVDSSAVVVSLVIISQGNHAMMKEKHRLIKIEHEIILICTITGGGAVPTGMYHRPTYFCRKAVTRSGFEWWGSCCTIEPRLRNPVLRWVATLTLLMPLSLPLNVAAHTRSQKI